MTSLGGVTVDKRNFKNGYDDKLLPVSPTPKHPNHGIQLHLRNEKPVDRTSYVETHKRYWVDYNHLERYLEGPCTFTEASLQTMIDHSGIKVARSRQLTSDSQSMIEHAPKTTLQATLQRSENRRCWTLQLLEFYRNSPLTQPPEDIMQVLNTFRSFVNETRDT
jgi:hypothetical protein